MHKVSEKNKHFHNCVTPCKRGKYRLTVCAYFLFTSPPTQYLNCLLYQVTECIVCLFGRQYNAHYRRERLLDFGFRPRIFFFLNAKLGCEK